MRRARRRSSLTLAIWGLLACGGGNPELRSSEAAKDESASEPPKAVADCPDSPRKVDSSPGVEERHTRLEFWLEHSGASQPGAEPLLGADEITGLNEAASELDGAWRDPLADELTDAERVRTQLSERVEWMRGQVVSGKYVEAEEGDFARAAKRVDEAETVDELRMVVEESSLRCMPLDGSLFKPPVDEDFDRNNCASLHAGEWVRVLRRHEAGGERWDYVHAGHSVGWLRGPALTVSIELEKARSLRSGAQWVVLRDGAKTKGGRSFRLGARLPALGDGVVLVPTPDGLVEDHFEEGPAAAFGDAQLTRELVWGAALSELGAPYGWGGRAGERDCSRLVRDAFLPAGLQLARHSAVQAKLGSEVVDVSMLDEAAKRARIEAAAQQGLVLLYMPGHIMIYLGRDGEHQYAVSSISEYWTPCEGGPDTVNRIDRVAVTTLELGRDTKKRAFIERITALVVFGPAASGD